MTASKVNFQTFSDLLQDIGYKAKIEEKCISSRMAGYHVIFFINDAKDFQIYFGISGKNEKFTLENSNSFNKKMRFAKSYIDRDGDLNIEGDFRFELSGPNAKEELSAIIDIWEYIMSEAKETFLSD